MDVIHVASAIIFIPDHVIPKTTLPHAAPRAIGRRYSGMMPGR